MANTTSSPAPVSFATKLYRWRVLLARRWWVLLLCMSVSVCVMAIMLKNTPEKYVSFGRLLISGRFNISEGVKFSDDSQNFLPTQIELLKSPSIQGDAIKRLQTLQPELRPSAVLLNVAQTKQADIILLEAIGFEPKFTQAFLDAVMEEYLDKRGMFRDDATKRKIAQIQEQLSKAERDLNEALDRYQKFKSENSLELLREQNISSSARLATLNTELSTLDIEIRSLEGLTPLQQLEGGAGPRPVPKENALGGADPVLTQTSYQATKERLDLLKIDLEERSEILRPAHPKIVELNEQISRFEKTLGLYQLQGIEDIKRRRLTLENKRRTLQDAAKDLETKALTAAQKVAQHDSLKSTVDRVQKEYDRFAEMLKDVLRGNRLGEEPVKILEHACDAFLKERKMAQNLAIGAIGGLMLGLGILFLIDKMDDRINTSNELLDALDDEILGQIPEQETKRKQKHIPLLVPDEERHAFAEAYRNIRSSLLFLDTPEFKPRTFVITSSIPSEGKSTVSTNLALTLANAGQRVLLIDADLRRGALKDLLGVKSDLGLTEVLRGKAEWTSAIKTTDNPNLFFIPRGAATNKAGELFLTPTMDVIIREAPQKFDYVFFDSAPILATDDTATFAPKIDGVLFVLRASFTGSRAIRASIEQLRTRGANVLGIIFNRISESMPDYQYYKYSEYYATKEND